jgi:hypothetical protein
MKEKKEKSEIRETVGYYISFINSAFIMPESHVTKKKKKKITLRPSLLGVSPKGKRKGG